LETADNSVPLDRIVLPRDAKLTAIFDEKSLGGVVKIQGEALLVDDADWGDELYRFDPVRMRPYVLTAIPYYAWDHRTPGEMRVWIRSL
ncbi:MAG: glycoside hydrolase family 127 protein, partial [Limnochordia bacterium]